MSTRTAPASAVCTSGSAAFSWGVPAAQLAHGGRPPGLHFPVGQKANGLVRPGAHSLNREQLHDLPRLPHLRSGLGQAQLHGVVAAPGPEGAVRENGGGMPRPDGYVGNGSGQRDRSGRQLQPCSCLLIRGIAQAAGA